MQYSVRVVEADDGRRPFQLWVGDLTDRTAKIRILKAINRLEEGKFGSVKPVGSGVSALKIDYGPGYRVYFGIDNGQFILLLGGRNEETPAIRHRKSKDSLATVQKMGES